MNIILLLFLSMLKIGCFAFGGGSDRHTDYMETNQKERVFLYSACSHFGHCRNAFIWNINIQIPIYRTGMLYGEIISKCNTLYFASKVVCFAKQKSKEQQNFCYSFIISKKSLGDTPFSPRRLVQILVFFVVFWITNKCNQKRNYRKE